MAFRDGKPAGRIAAIVNRSHNGFYGDKTGFFGFFDFADDLEVARRLLDTAGETLRSRGFTAFRGPYNPTVNDDCGVLAEGFETPAMVMMPYNPSYYLARYEELGLEKAAISTRFIFPRLKRPRSASSGSRSGYASKPACSSVISS